MADDDPTGSFDEGFIGDAPFIEGTSRRHSGTPLGKPVPWRSYSDPRGILDQTLDDLPLPKPRERPRRAKGQRPSSAARWLIALGLVASGVGLAVLARNGHDGTPSRSAPAPLNTISVSTGPASHRPVVAQASARARPTAVALQPSVAVVAPPPTAHSWKLATVAPFGTLVDSTEAFRTLAGGTCLTEDAAITAYVVPCQGSHTDEVAGVVDLSGYFSADPSGEQVDAIARSVCAASYNAYLGGIQDLYATGYLWRFDNDPGSSGVRRLACIVQLAGHSPFTGTLFHAVA